jgi:BirA family biotin operon repressor/biotin-[acetyl-CoA-carboxylase] ligase
LDAAALRVALTPPSGPFSRLDVADDVASTNADLVAIAAGPAGAAWPDLSVLTAEHQRAGRGRLGRTWTTPPHAALATSVLLRPDVPVARWSWIPLLAGLSVTETLRSVAGVQAELKWPNDVLVPEAGGATRKVAGVLTEVVATGQGSAVVVGTGVNVSQRRDELATGTATSLLLAGARTLDRDTLLRATLRSFAEAYRGWTGAGGDAVACGLAARVRESCSTIGRLVRVELPGGAGLTGTAEGVDDEGRLLVGTGSGVSAVAAGDVVHVRT